MSTEQATKDILAIFDKLGNKIVPRAEQKIKVIVEEACYREVRREMARLYLDMFKDKTEYVNPAKYLDQVMVRVRGMTHKNAFREK